MVNFTHSSAIFFVHANKGGALSDILYFLVVRGHFAWSDFLECQTAMIFGDQAISTCLHNRHLAVEQAERSS